MTSLELRLMFLEMRFNITSMHLLFVPCDYVIKAIKIIKHVKKYCDDIDFLYMEYIGCY